MAYRYTLEPYKGLKSRYRCPNCQKQASFTRYIDTDTGKHLSDKVGKCSREFNCAYHYTPKQFLEANKPLSEAPAKPFLKVRKADPKTAPPSFIPLEAFKASLDASEENHFIKYLIRLVGREHALKAIGRYFIGTSTHWPGATIFWQINNQGKIMAGKIIQYNPDTGKRVKEPSSRITWVHSSLRIPDFRLKQCLFGEHLLKTDLIRPCAIVESEKTAVIASIYLPEFIWLASGSLYNLKPEIIEVLKRRTVVLFPDLNCYTQWQAKAQECSPIARISVSDLLEKKATQAERDRGFDLADYLVKYDHRQFTQQGNAIAITANDVVGMLGQTNTGKDFNQLIIAGIKTRHGKIYDLIYDANGDLLPPSEQLEAVQRLSRFFDKRLFAGTLDGLPCWIHEHK